MISGGWSLFKGTEYRHVLINYDSSCNFILSVTIPVMSLKLNFQSLFAFWIAVFHQIFYIIQYKFYYIFYFILRIDSLLQKFHSISQFER